MIYCSEWKDLVANFGYGFVYDIEQYKYIVKIRAYADMQPRTIGGIRDFRQSDDNNTKLNNLLDELARKLYNYVIKESTEKERNFDSWHKQCCEWFVNAFNELTQGNNVDSIAFGKAQKIINVSLKYIFCLKGSDMYAERFKYCHMILDRYTYSEGFYKKEVIPWVNKKDKSKQIKSTALTSWSKLNYNEYCEIQKNIRVFLQNSTEYVDNTMTPLTPFQAEFYIFGKYNSK